MRISENYRRVLGYLLLLSNYNGEHRETVVTGNK